MGSSASSSPEPELEEEIDSPFSISATQGVQQQWLRSLQPELHSENANEKKIDNETIAGIKNMTQFATMRPKQTNSPQQPDHASQELEQEKMRQDEENLRQEQLNMTRQKQIEEEKRQKQQMEQLRNDKQDQIEEAIENIKKSIADKEETEEKLIEQVKSTVTHLEESVTSAKPPSVQHKFQIDSCTSCIASHGIEQCRNEIKEYQTRVWQSA